MKNYLPEKTKSISRSWLKLLLLVLLTSFQQVVQAQSIAVSGKVQSEEYGEGLPGVNVLIKDTNQGTITDVNGEFKLDVLSEATVLVFSFVGYQSQEMAVGSQGNIDVRLLTDARQLSEVVVTALGIEREKRALGYAVQEIDGEQLTQARETNVVNSLAGKIAGVNVTGGSSGVGGSSRITIRGESSLNNDNQPLFVVDGIPISNQMFGSSGRNNLEVDYGNGAAAINPDDVASITVLKGANASALYGSRALNGVILITTKSGKGSKGVGVSINSNVTFETPLVLPKWQNRYGQGNNGEFSFEDGSNGGLNDGVDESWGPGLNGQLLPQFDSPTANGFRGGDVSLPNRGEITPTPWVASPDNVTDFFETGITFSNNVAVAGANDKGNFRLSYTNLDQKGIMPNTDFGKNTISFAAGYNLTDKLKVGVNTSYIQSSSANRPSLSYGTESIMYLFTWYGRQVNTDNLKDYWQPGLEGVQQFNYNYNYHDNPYFTLYENTNGQDQDRLIGNITLNYTFTDWLSLQVRTGIDYFDELREKRRAFSTQRFPFGQYREERIGFEERNSDFLFTFNKNLSDKVALTVSAGGNRMSQSYNSVDIEAPQLSIPGIYNFGNSRVDLSISQNRNEKNINSVYGLAQFAYNHYLYLDITARNDWSSTLPQDNNSYFYPSVSASAILSDIFDISSQSPLSFAKVRAGWAQVGSDTDPYRLASFYEYSTPFGNSQTVTESSILANPNLKPEIANSYEIGVDVRFFNGRLGLDATYYRMESENQVLQIPLAVTSGYTAKFLNAGLIRNEGLEVMLNAVPLQIQDGFKWDITLNWSTNMGKVIELDEGLGTYLIAQRNGAYIEARVGEQMGDIYGRGFKRVKDESSPYFGQQIFNSEGLPITDSELVYQGNYNPDWQAGLYNTFSWKGLSLGVLVDVRKGGTIVSRTKTIASTAGQLEETLEGRENGYDLSLPGNGIIGEGVIENEDGSYTPNTIKAPVRDWNYAYYNRSNVEAAKYDASYIKLREVKINYNLPEKLFHRLPFSNVSVALVARNLALWTENPHIDPETYALSGGRYIPGVENMQVPSSRSYGINLNLKF